MSAATHEEGQKQGVAKACFMSPFQRLQQGVRGRINSPLIRLLTPTPISATYSRDRGKSLQSKNLRVQMVCGKRAFRRKRWRRPMSSPPHREGLELKPDNQAWGKPAYLSFAWKCFGASVISTTLASAELFS